VVETRRADERSARPLVVDAVLEIHEHAVGLPPIHLKIFVRGCFRLLVVAASEAQRYYRRTSAMSVRRIEEARPS
jgi:hypothetical protein